MSVLPTIGRRNHVKSRPTRASLGSTIGIAVLLSVTSPKLAIPDSSRTPDSGVPATEAGVPAAQLAFSRRLASGNGVEQDYIAAHMWANLAAAGGAEGARDQRDVVARFLSPEDLQRAQEMASAWREARPQ